MKTGIYVGKLTEYDVATTSRKNVKTIEKLDTSCFGDVKKSCKYVISNQIH